MGRWCKFGVLPRVGESVNLLPSCEWMTEVHRIEHWPDDDVIVLQFHLNMDCGEPGSWSLDHPGCELDEYIKQNLTEGVFDACREDEHFPAA